MESGFWDERKERGYAIKPKLPESLYKSRKCSK